MPTEYLAHYGVKGMHWGIRKERPRSSTKYKRVGRIREGRTNTVNGKEYKQSFKTSRATRKASKWLMKSVENPSNKSIINASKWANKAQYEKYRDMGRTRKTTLAKGIGIGTGVTSVTVGALGTSAALGAMGASSLAAFSPAVIGLGSAYVGRVVYKKAKRREYKSGYRLAEGKIKAVTDETQE